MKTDSLMFRSGLRSAIVIVSLVAVIAGWSFYDSRVRQRRHKAADARIPAAKRFIASDERFLYVDTMVSDVQMGSLVFIGSVSTQADLDSFIGDAKKMFTSTEYGLAFVLSAQNAATTTSSTPHRP